MMFEYRINVDDELKRLLGSYHLFIPHRVLKELQMLSMKGRGKRKRLAKASLKLVDSYEIYPGFLNLEADDAIISAAEECSAIVLTNDRKIRKRLHEKSLQSIFLRQKSHLMIE
jgi:rRNA-processing protein FCF1